MGTLLMLFPVVGFISLVQPELCGKCLEDTGKLSGGGWITLGIPVENAHFRSDGQPVFPGYCGGRLKSLPDSGYSGTHHRERGGSAVMIEYIPSFCSPKFRAHAGVPGSVLACWHGLGFCFFGALAGVFDASRF